ncbi:hypothetical protein RFI_06589 [Reticulomyxa filosa]|uniref:Uncharacterized protein n=1 Tax=Reticulomyxa filosa TaxID=46433 RepID=X6NX08_RETFI|nr:hypothetical protein RFI_06589 [Reticulomyxa filosa]|eukprot:ETO30531.1 hypothetical protein RFI_06589 [Reticulomyxa filosa]
MDINRNAINYQQSIIPELNEIKVDYNSFDAAGTNGEEKLNSAVEFPRTDSRSKLTTSECSGCGSKSYGEKTTSSNGTSEVTGTSTSGIPQGIQPPQLQLHLQSQSQSQPTVQRITVTNNSDQPDPSMKSANKESRPLRMAVIPRPNVNTMNSRTNNMAMDLSTKWSEPMFSVIHEEIQQPHVLVISPTHANAKMADPSHLKTLSISQPMNDLPTLNAATSLPTIQSGVSLPHHHLSYVGVFYPDEDVKNAEESHLAFVNEAKYDSESSNHVIAAAAATTDVTVKKELSLPTTRSSNLNKGRDSVGSITLTRSQSTPPQTETSSGLGHIRDFARNDMHLQLQIPGPASNRSSRDWSRQTATRGFDPSSITVDIRGDISVPRMSLMLSEDRNKSAANSNLNSHSLEPSAVGFEPIDEKPGPKNAIAIATATRDKHCLEGCCQS